MINVNGHAENRCELCAAAVEDRMRRRIRGAYMYFIAVVKCELDIGITASRWKFSTAQERHSRSRLRCFSMPLKYWFRW